MEQEDFKVIEQDCYEDITGAWTLALFRGLPIEAVIKILKQALEVLEEHETGEDIE